MQVNPTSTAISLSPVKAIENSALAGPEMATTELSDNAFSSEFTLAMQEAFTASGNSKPLDIADLNNLDVQQLTDLAEQMGINLPPELLSDSIDPKQSILNTLAREINPSVNGANLVANPNASEILKSAMVNGNTLKDGITENSLPGSQTNKPDLFNRVAPDEVLQQAAIKKEPGLANALTVVDSDTTHFMKDVDINRELLMQSGRQDMSSIKIADQLVSADKPINAINSISNPTVQVQSQTNSTTPAMMLNRVEVPVQQAGWGEAVGNRLIMMVNDKMQSANIHLNPEELGPIEVKIRVSQDQTTVHFVSNNSVVREAIEDAFPRLKEMFSQNGLNLSDANVSQQSSQQGDSFSKDENGSQAVSDTDLLEADEQQIESKQINIVDTGLVDHYV